MEGKMAKQPKKTTGGGKPDNGIPQPIDKDGNYSVLVEMHQRVGGSPSFAMGVARSDALPNFTLDEEYEPVSLNATAPGMAAAGPETYILRGTVKTEKEIDALRAQPDVAEVWIDTPIAPITEWAGPQLDDNPSMAPCPIPPCDCTPQTPKGTMANVAGYLGVDQIWTAGTRGTGIVVGVLDSGITAQGRTVKSGETTNRIPRVIGGWPSDWGTESGQWGNHGNMCATDVLGMAPDAQLYDLRIAGGGGSPGTISRALQAFNWAINQHRSNGTPQILTNSWGIFQESWDTTYARNPNHPFTRKVVEAINEGILILFAAGNCGDTCPDNRCGPDVGPGRSIWGANGHPLVMTVGAVNKNEQFIGYSSRGPAALDPNKPDFCSISHFTGYFNSDSGTSAATPILAGVVALLKQKKSGLTQNGCKSVLKATAKDIGPAGFDQHSGAGIVQALTAYRRLTTPTIRTLPPICRPTRSPIDPRCIRPTRNVRDPRCVRPTLNLSDPRCVRPTRPPRCIRRTLTGPACPRRTITGPSCIRQTLVGPNCPRQTLTGPNCLRQTLVGPNCVRVTRTPSCMRPSLAGCPRPTFSASMCTPVPFDYSESESWGDECYGDSYGGDQGYYDAPEEWGAEDYSDEYSPEEEWYDEGEYDEWYIQEDDEWLE